MQPGERVSGVVATPECSIDHAGGRRHALEAEASGSPAQPVRQRVQLAAVRVGGGEKVEQRPVLLDEHAQVALIALGPLDATQCAFAVDDRSPPPVDGPGVRDDAEAA